MKTAVLPLRRTQLTRIFTAAMIALLAVFAAATAANAPDELIGSTPASGSTVKQSPKQIVLNFSGELQTLEGAETTVVVITDEADKKIDNDFTVKGRNVTIVPATELVSGDYTVASRVISSDGHPIEKSIRFTVDTGDAATAPSETATASPQATQGTSAAPSDSSAAPSNSADEQAGTAAGISPVVWIVAGIAILGAAVAVLVNWSRRNNTK